MISERLASRSTRPVRRSRHERWALPAVAGRARLTEALGQSVLVQLMLAMSFVALAALLYMAQASQITVQQINIAVLRDSRQQLVAQNADLRSRADALQSLQRVQNIAITRFHMATPDITTAIWIRPRTVRVSPLPLPGGDVAAAERASSPLTWIEHTLTVIHDSL